MVMILPLRTTFKNMIKRMAMKIKCMIATVIFYPLKVDSRKIVIDCFGGKGYGDNPKYLAEELVKLGYKIVWLVNGRNVSIPLEIKTVPYGSFQSLYEFSTSFMWIDNVRDTPRPIFKKSGQTYLQTWHGPFSPKKLEKDSEKLLPRNYIVDAKRDGRQTDAILANSFLEEIQYKRAFWLNKECKILRFGLPRNDALVNYSNSIEIREKVRKTFSIESDTYVVLYAPTFRDDYSLEGYYLDFERVIQAFENNVEKKVALIIRLHPNVNKQTSWITFDDTIINGSLYPDIQELSIASDCLISDYSTTLFDFVLLDKPAFVCALDIKHYKQIRGLLDEFYSFPFPIAYTNDELLDRIANFDDYQYKESIDTYLKKYPMYDTGHATKQVVEWINML